MNEAGSEHSQAPNPEIVQAVNVAVDHWLRWVAKWQPGSQRTRSNLCRKCTGSPLVQAAGIKGDVPHQVTHALVSRLHRIIDRTVDDYTERHLTALHAELEGESLWKAPAFDPTEGLEPEYDGVDVDPLPDSEVQPFLFTLQGLAEETTPEPALPRPPLSADEKAQLRRDIDAADQIAVSAGQQVCFAVAEHRSRISSAITHFVEPQIQDLLSELSRHLEPPQ
ncbi:MAG: spermidine/putrescine ABC transporter substrate-binding protein [Canibacter sp.]